MTTTNVINDGNNINAQVVEATVGNGSSSVILNNQGVLTNGNSTHPGSFSSDNEAFTTNGNGSVTSHNVTPSGNLSVTGNVSLNASATNQVGSNLMLRFVIVNFTASSTVQTINHTLGITPKLVYAHVTTGTFLPKEITAVTSTTFTAGNLGVGSSYTAVVIG